MWRSAPTPKPLYGDEEDFFALKSILSDAHRCGHCANHGFERPQVNLHQFEHRLHLEKLKALTSEHLARTDPLTLVIGGVSFGGAGKSQVVLHIAENLLCLGLGQICILGHGYKGKVSRLKARIVNLGESNAIQQFGDEAVMMSRRLGDQVPIIVGGNWRDRWNFAVDLGAKMIISDGGLYTANLPRHISLTVLSSSQRERLFPFGDLTRPPSKWIHGPQTWRWTISSPQKLLHEDSHLKILDLDSKAETLKEYGSYELFSQTRLCHFEDADGRLHPSNWDFINRQKRFGVISAIANPNRITKHLELLNIHIERTVFLKDHSLIPTNLQDLVRRDGDFFWITTEKDRMKFPIPPSNLITSILTLEPLPKKVDDQKFF